MFSITLEKYTLVMSEGFPTLYSEYHKRAKLVDLVEGGDLKQSMYFLSVARGSDWPLLIVVRWYTPGPDSGFYPGVALIPETHLIFIGAGEQVLAYSLDPLKKLWEESVMVGFWGWARHQQFVIMSAELELAVWDIQGEKRWSVFVEPPWNYTIEDKTVHLDVMGKQSSFSLLNGPTVR